MKLIRFGEHLKEKPGIILDNGRFDVSAFGAGGYNLFVDLEYAGQVAPARYEGEFDVLAPESARFPFAAGVVFVLCLCVLYFFRGVVVSGLRQVWDWVLGVFGRPRQAGLRARFVLDSSGVFRDSSFGNGRAGPDGSGSYLRGRNDWSGGDSYQGERKGMRKDGSD